MFPLPYVLIFLHCAKSIDILVNKPEHLIRFSKLKSAQRKTNSDLGISVTVITSACCTMPH